MMKFSLIIIILTIFLFLFEVEVVSTDFLKNDKTNSYPGGILQLQQTSPVSVYVPYIEEAKIQKAEIIVFPELGLIQESISSYEIVEVGSFPCKNSEIPIQQAISCAASRNRIYVVFDMAERGEKCDIGTKYCGSFGFYIYNTAIVIDRSGIIIEKYRKHNLYKTETMFRPGPPSCLHFTTDFGVEFGVFVCFDLLWKLPAEDMLTKFKINNIIFPTHWVDLGILFLYGSEVQQGYSEFFQLNLLAANNVEASTGSGIYSKGLPLNHTDEIATKLLVADIPIFEYIDPPKIGNTKKFQWVEESNLEVFKAYPGKKISVHSVLQSHVCEFQIEVESGNEYFIVGALSYLNSGVKSESCALLNCGPIHTINVTDCFGKIDDPKTVFRFFQMNMTVFDEVRMILPLISTTGRSPVREFDKIKHSHEKNSHVILMNGVEEPITFAVQFGVMNITNEEFC